MYSSVRWEKVVWTFFRLSSSRVEKTIADNLGEAVQLGARLFACSDALAAQGLAAPDLMPGCERGGAVQFMARAMDLRWRALVF